MAVHDPQLCPVQPNSRSFCHFNYHLDLYCVIEWKARHADSGSRVFADRLAEDLHHQIGKSIDSRHAEQTLGLPGADARLEWTLVNNFDLYCAQPCKTCAFAFSLEVLCFALHQFDE